ncbi:MAG: TIGR01244 family sulfur transferase [Sphingomonas adhaesiva]
MEFTHLADNFAVSAQLDVADVERARRAGFRSIIANRLDGEDARQPSAAQIAAEATRLGLAFAHIPIGFTQAGDADADAMARAMRELPKPILAYCRTGTRSAALWALGLAPDSEPGELVRRAAAAGHKITALMPSLRRRAGGR